MRRKDIRGSRLESPYVCGADLKTGDALPIVRIHEVSDTRGSALARLPSLTDSPQQSLAAISLCLAAIELFNPLSANPTHTGT